MENVQNKGNFLTGKIFHSFQTNVPFPYLLKMSENVRLFDPLFHWYKNGTMVWNGLMVCFLSPFFAMFPFDLLWKHQENLVWCFQGDQKETLGRKGLKNKSFSNFGKYPSSERSFENPKLNLATYWKKALFTKNSEIFGIKSA